MQTEMAWGDMPRTIDTPRGTDNMRDTLIIALEASWELDPVLMEDKLWKRIEDNPEEKAYRVKSEENKKA